MHRNAIFAVLIALLLAGMIWADSPSSTKDGKQTGIEGHGKVARFPDAVEQPREGSKIVVDLTAGGPPDQMNSGLEKVARFVNIYHRAGKASAQVKICVVLHGDATTIALDDAVYAAAHKSDRNPNLPLVRKLREAGVELVVCGQALTLKGYRSEQATKEAQVAVSGLTALVNRQQDGYAYIPLPKP